MTRASFRCGSIRPTGTPRPSDTPHRLRRESGTLVEIPSTTLRFLGGVWPASGGAYFRLLPYALVRAGLRQAALNGSPGMFYIHPWELDDWRPPVAASRLQLIRTFGGRKRIWDRMAHMLGEFDFGRVGDTAGAMATAADL